VRREMIELDLPRNDINAWVIAEFKRLGRCIAVDQVKDMYKVDDMVLSGTNEIKDMYTKMLTGIDPIREKYYITENNRLHSNGEIIVSSTKPELCKSEIRHCFTTHSIQGETALFNLFIDSARMFDARMFYTAISRAKKLSQIVIIESPPAEFKYENACIYKITSSTGVYIGSSLWGTIESRLTEHKNDARNYKLKKGKFVTSFTVLDGKQVKIEKVMNFKCNDKKDLWKQEAIVVQSCKCVNKTFAEGK
jgi:hypothetical protein